MFNYSGMSGYFGEDLIGGLGVDQEDFVFGQVTKYSSASGAGYNIDGHIGLSNIDSYWQNKNFVQVLYENDQIPNPSFSIYLGRTGQINRLVLGGINPQYNTS